MREDWKLIERPNLKIHAEYTFITAGELGNMLLRLQAFLRAYGDLGKKRYIKELDGQPHIVVSTFHTEHSIELWIAVAGLIYNVFLQPVWNDFAKYLWRRTIATLFQYFKGRIPSEDFWAQPDDFDIKLTKGDEEKLILNVNLNELDKDKIYKIDDLTFALLQPTDEVTLGDDEYEIVITKKKR